MNHIRLAVLTAAILAAVAVGTKISPVEASGLHPQTTPTPVPTTPPAPTPAPQTLESLQAALRSRLFAPEARRARVGLKVVAAPTGKLILENDSEKYFMPASNMKNFTVAAAFDQLGPDFKFVTSVFASGPPDPSGTIRGDLRVLGRGDVSISTFFATRPGSDPEVYYERLDRLADAIIAAGVKRIEGGLVADESYFKGNAVPLTWEWDDLQWDDGAEVSAFPLNNNAVDLVVKGTAAGRPCDVSILPPTALYVVNNSCVTSGTKSGIVLKKALDRNILNVSGSMPAGQRWSGSVTFTRPADLFVSLLKERLMKKGVLVSGPTRSISAGGRGSEQAEIARLESPPFREIAAKTMKPSQNMFTEVILWTLGEEIGRKNGGNGESSQLGIKAVRSWMTSAGIPSDAVVQYDGSGMSRHDLVTPSAVVQLYDYMAKSKNAQAWRDSLAVGGIDGTLRRRFAGTLAAGNFRGKTGTLDQVSALSGYVRTAGGEEVIVSILVNGLPELPKRLALIDGIVLEIANFNGKIDQQ